MSIEVFGSTYSATYDLLYADKDYEQECDLLEDLFHRFGDGTVRRILDLGCGTGSHAIRLARRGYTVSGVDRSHGMLEVARAKALAAGVRVCWIKDDLATLRLAESYDACLFMFAVLSYQVEHEQVLAALNRARRHLRPGGLVIFDVWYGPSVLATGPTDRVKVVATEEGRVIRVASPALDVRHHRCLVRYQTWHLLGKRLADEAAETHAMRFFFPLELEHYLHASDFDLVLLAGLPSLESPPRVSDWNTLGVGRARLEQDARA